MSKLYVVGTGNGNIDDLTLKALRVLLSVDTIYCDEMLYKKYDELFHDKLVSNKYNETSLRCDNAIRGALEGRNVAILGSGDTGIYGIANIILERVANYSDLIDVEVLPGITYALSGAALLGSPITQDFAVMTLSDNLANKEQLPNKLTTLAQSDLAIVFYSICNPTKDNLHLARKILLKYRSPKTIVGITTSIGNPNQEMIISNLEEMPIDKVNSYSTLFVGNQKTKVYGNRIITPLI